MFLFYSPNLHISKRRPLYFCCWCLFVDFLLTFCFPVCRLSIEAVLWEKGDNVYTGSPAESLSGNGGYDAALVLGIVSVSDVKGRKRRRCRSAHFIAKQKKKVGTQGKKLQSDQLKSNSLFVDSLLLSDMHTHTCTHSHVQLHTAEYPWRIISASQTEKAETLIPHWTT